MKVSERTEEIVRQKDKLDELNSTKDKLFHIDVKYKCLIISHTLKSVVNSLRTTNENNQRKSNGINS